MYTTAWRKKKSYITERNAIILLVGQSRQTVAAAVHVWIKRAAFISIAVALISDLINRFSLNLSQGNNDVIRCAQTDKKEKSAFDGDVTDYSSASLISSDSAYITNWWCVIISFMPDATYELRLLVRNTHNFIGFQLYLWNLFYTGL